MGNNGSKPPSISIQMVLSGAIIMADWLASDTKYFIGVNNINDVSFANAYLRAESAWKKLGFSNNLILAPKTLPDDELFKKSFSFAPRNFQAKVLSAAEYIGQGGLMILEAAMGEGKTEAALGAAYKILSDCKRGGIFYGLPSQATSDAIYKRLNDWATNVEIKSPINLLHGKRRFNHEWVKKYESKSFANIDEYGCNDEYGIINHSENESEPLEWFLGNKRGLLAPIVVGTVDHLLLAASRARHFMLRQLGLINKIVVIDEVHSFDIFMSQFLYEILRWLGNARVPVIMLSATLASDYKKELIEAYLSGFSKVDSNCLSIINEQNSFPLLTVAKPGLIDSKSIDTSKAENPITIYNLESTFTEKKVTIQLIGDETDDKNQIDILHKIINEAQNAKILIIKNTVKRAQSFYQILTEHIDKENNTNTETILLHGRFTDSDKFRLTEEVLSTLGKERTKSPDKNIVVVATQIVEQSLDIDADILITDIAPIDLMFQRMGRIQRHEREDRWCHEPLVFITGFTRHEGNQNWNLDDGTKFIYHEYLLIKTLDFLCKKVNNGQQLNIPNDIRTSIEAIYNLSEEGNRSYLDELTRFNDTRNTKKEESQKYIIPKGKELFKMANLGELYEDNSNSGKVRDSDEEIEVILGIKDNNLYYTLSEIYIGEHCEGISSEKILSELIGSTIKLRLNLFNKIKSNSIDTVNLKSWNDDPWLNHRELLCLNRERKLQVGNHETYVYDEKLGLINESSLFRN
jgi:CRISPR-associated endonuclease/helicase Cas3